MALLEREQFLLRLTGLLTEARRGRGRLALVFGEAGIGKTTLVESFCARVPTPTRILWGTCDPLVPPRPLMPIVDIAEQVGGDLRRGLDAGDRDAVLDAFLTLLRRPGASPVVVVLDDLHWADDATLDLLGVVGRRVTRMPALVIGTYRDTEIDRDHPLRMALGLIPANSMVEIRLPPLSIAAVRELAAGRADVSALYAATGGNPFFVTEVLAAGVERVPTTVRDAVLTRLAHLSPAAREVVRAAAVLGPGCSIRTLLDVAGEQRSALEEGVDRALLELVDGTVSFRHELARGAVIDTLEPASRVALHRRALEVLRTPSPVDWPRLARHAIAIGDTSAILELAREAAGRAAMLGSHREAAAFYGAAVEVAGALPERERAELLEQYARECSLTDDVPRALNAQASALDVWRTLGDEVREGACLVGLSMLLWLGGRGDEAMAAAASAVELLEVAAPGTAELAQAWAVLAQRQMVAGHDDRAIEWASRSLELAEQIGNEPLAVHALTTSSVARIFMGDPSGWSTLEDAAARARAADLAEETARALINLVEAARDLRRYDLAARYLALAGAHLEEHEVDLYHDILRSRVAALELETGRWDAAEADAMALLELGGAANPIRVRALTIIGHLRARRAVEGAWAALDEALGLAGGELQELLPLRAARAEAAWLAGDDRRAQAEAASGLRVGPRETSPWWWSELAFWGWKAGATEPLPDPAERPYWLHVSGQYTEAAEAWASIGAPYQEGLALSDCDAEPDLRRALDIFNALGAVPMARRVAQRLQRLGARRIPRGPRAQTRRNPAGLTARQFEILDLIAAGLGNSEIADRLVITPKTVDHHVSAILHKLGVPNRAAAADAARRFGLAGAARQDGEIVPAR